ncbi:hypothetical protein I7I48_02437 [Histoplasma ohiense]|nr:hypothetical protein I7I48_02437 [Histoplasma ohiense (nom. inval.)]
MYPNISYVLLSAALIMLSMVHLILLTVHHFQPHCLSEISIFVLFICVNAVVIGIGLSGLRCGGEMHTPARNCGGHTCPKNHQMRDPELEAAACVRL